MNHHQTVLLDEAVNYLIAKPGGCYVDGTFGRGGHSRLILNSLDTAGRLLAIDKDNEAVLMAQQQFASDQRFSIAQGSFASLPDFLAAKGWVGKLDGLLLDLGVSSPQLDQASRGFSFMKAGPLDMRMDTTQSVSAESWVNSVDEAGMVHAFKAYGEERFAKRIARAIIARRLQKPFATTDDLAEVVKEANPAWEKHKHPATRVFQAIRIAVNEELSDLEKVLAESIDMLAVGGRLVVISFHSLEDRIVKRFIRQQEKGKVFPKDVPVTESQLDKRVRSIGRAMKPSAGEVDENPRARSAVMRVAEKVA